MTWYPSDSSPFTHVQIYIVIQVGERLKSPPRASDRIGPDMAIRD
jgi:hypothetical protein